MRPAPAGNRNRTFMPPLFPPRGEPGPPDIFTVTMQITGCTFQEAVARLARAAGLLPAEPACEHKAEA
jgi:hypothetical protein